MKKVNVLFVCKGNICRSPTAEGVFRKLVSDEGLDSVIRTDSAGTHAYHIGKLPDTRAQKTALTHGIDLSDLRGRQIASEDFETFDYVVAMDNENMHILSESCPPDQRHKLSLFLSFSPDAKDTEVPDPYWQGEDRFEPMFEMLQTASHGLLDTIKKQYTLK